MGDSFGAVNRTSSGADMSIVTEENAKGAAGPRPDVGVEKPNAESTCSEWTNEKHSLYLNFIEASFVNQLYNHEYGSTESLGWYSGGKEAKGPTSSQSTASSCFSSGQFKVLRSGCWEKLNFEKACSLRDSKNGMLLANPWVQHFRPPSSNKVPEMVSIHLQENRCLVKKHKIPKCGVAKCSTVDPKDYDLNFVSKDSEVSDQNFADENCCCGEEQDETKSRKKRVRTTTADFSSNDQVVPSANSEAPENLPSRRKVDASCK
ncbi:hypothetical protein H6P81_010954 [Aristolochia fimbriata]|uniref:Uncharacterized protein n=1 Tax=Aristolochia fimbriata TaxID=158543 RepID=A0AAV7EQW5_ARIFI|nr:hypothetical protein H6P81_010954 [Aristolochia fimbriata]